MFQQSFRIASGRPSSSDYFDGARDDNSFYLDPNYARPANS
jgi:hypothetical protein